MKTISQRIQMYRNGGCGGRRDGRQVRIVTTDMLTMQLRTAANGRSSGLIFDCKANGIFPQEKKNACCCVCDNTGILREHKF